MKYHAAEAEVTAAAPGPEAQDSGLCVLEKRTGVYLQPGMNITALSGIPSEAQCLQECNNTVNCQSALYLASAQKCWLKSGSQADTVPAPTSDSVLLFCATGASSDEPSTSQPEATTGSSGTKPKLLCAEVFLVGCFQRRHAARTQVLISRARPSQPWKSCPVLTLGCCAATVCGCCEDSPSAD